jgi:Mlc titration factor MtfA (ptsG expression regulator)
MIAAFIGRLFGQTKAPVIAEEGWKETLAQLPFLMALAPADLARLRRLAEDFLAEKEFTTTGGLELNDAICLSIAVQGCLPILNLGLDWYRDWVGIIVYPDEFVIPRTIEDEDGIVHEYDELASGEAWGGGPLLISWRDVQMAGSGYNVAIHEFAHKLDMRTGEADGVPPLHSGMSREKWEKTLHAAYEEFCKEVDAAELADGETELDPYASENPAEFFAVISEAFFETPDLVNKKYPDLYEQLTLFYRQDLLENRR